MNTFYLSENTSNIRGGFWKLPLLKYDVIITKYFHAILKNVLEYQIVLNMHLGYFKKCFFIIIIAFILKFVCEQINPFDRTNKANEILF